MNQLLKTKPEISAWLGSMKIKNYILVPDKNYGFMVNVKGSVFLEFKQLDYIPVKFNEVTGAFSVLGNNLTSLLGSPITVGVDFNCSDNALCGLEFSAHYVGGSFWSRINYLTSLKFSPKEVGGHFFCGHNHLKSLYGAPKIIPGDFECGQNLLTDLSCCPQSVGGNFFCNDNASLGEIQSIIDFKTIKKIHEQHKKAIKEKKELDLMLSGTLKKSKAKNKI